MGGGRRRKGKRSVGGYSSSTVSVREEFTKAAHQNGQNHTWLKNKLKDAVFRQACARCGVTGRELKIKTIEDFRRLPGRVQLLAEDEQLMRMEDYERNRLELLAQILSAEDDAREALMIQKESEAELQGKLAQRFKHQLARERALLKRMSNSREKYEKVLEQENKQLMSDRAASMHHLTGMRSRHEAIASMKKTMRDSLQKRAKAREERNNRTKQERKETMELRRRQQMLKMKERDRRVNGFLSNKRGAQGKAKTRERQVNEFRAQRRAAAKTREEATRKALLKRMDDKADAVRRLRAERDAERARQRTKKNLMAKARQEKAERLRRVRAYEKQKLIDKMHSNYERMDNMKAMREAIEKQRKAIKREEIIRRANWKETTPVERGITPGPGSYEAPDTMTDKGGAWGKHKPKSEFDWIELRAAESPGPGAYQVEKGSLNLKGGSWSMYTPKSDVEWKMYWAAQMPGPGAYTPEPVKSKGSTIKFSDGEPMSDLDRTILRARETPGPGHYSPEKSGQMAFGRQKKSLTQLAKTFGGAATQQFFAKGKGEGGGGGKRRPRTSRH